MAEENESYTKSAAERRLQLIKAQLISQTQEDSVIGRQLKAAKRKDLSAQIQPLVAQVQLKAASPGGGKPRGPAGMPGRMVAGRSGKMGVNIATQQVNWMNPGSTGQGGPGGNKNVRYFTGRTTVVDKGATWTTEGYIDNASQPREQARQMVDRSLYKNTGIVYDRKHDSETGKGYWSGKLGTFDTQSGGFTPLTPMDQKERGTQILAEQAKKRSKEQAASIATVPPPPGR